MADIIEPSTIPVESGGNSNGDVIDPASIGGSASEPEQPVRKRKPRSDAGQPRGGTRARTAKTSEKVALDLSSLEGMFVGLHVLIATQTGTPEFMLGPDEGKQFMQAAQNVMRHYSVQTTQKALDWIAFAGVTSGMYVPRIAAVAMRKKQNRQPVAQRRPSPAANVADVSAAIQPDVFGQGFQEAAE